MKRALSISGIVLVVIAFVGIFAFGMIVSPPPNYVMVAAETIPAGTALASVPDSAFRQVSISTDATVLSTMLTGADLRQAQSRGGILIKTLLTGEPVLWTSIIVAGNPASGDRSVLGLMDPNLVSFVVPVTLVPQGLGAGDYVDLTLVISDVRNNQGSSYTAPSYGGNTYPPTYGVPTGQAFTPTLTPTATMTPTPAFVIPLGKTILYGVEVLHVHRSQSVQTSSSASSLSMGTGEVVAIEVAIPRQSQDLMAMAISAGTIYVSQTSLTAQQLSAGPSMGASVQDIIDLFYSDREKIATQGAPTFLPTYTPNPTKAGQ
jgi:hypothetical protein